MGKVVWIVGASSGLGFDLASRLLENGHTVYATARSLDHMKPLEEKGAKIRFVDVQDKFTTFRVMDEIIENEGKIDVVVSNAGYGYYGPIEQEIDEVKRQFDVNVFGMARVLNACLPHMRKQKSGTIIITASLSSNVTAGGLGWYAATKHALKAMAESLRMELHHLGIHIVQMEPGVFKTNFQVTAQHEYLNREYPKEYKPILNRFFNRQVKRFNKAPSTKSTVDGMVHAVESDNPKYIYRTTRDAKLFVFLKRFVSTKFYTWLIIKAYK